MTTTAILAAPAAAEMTAEEINAVLDQEATLEREAILASEKSDDAVPARDVYGRSARVACSDRRKGELRMIRAHRAFSALVTTYGFDRAVSMLGAENGTDARWIIAFGRPLADL